MLQQICTGTAGMDGAFPIYVDYSLASDAYTATGDLNLGSATTLVGVFNQSNAKPPKLTTGHHLSAPVEIRDVAIASAISGTCFTTNPTLLRLSGTTALTCSSGATFYQVNDAAGGAGYQLYAGDAAVIGDGTNAVLTIGAAGVIKLYLTGTAKLLAGAIPPPVTGGSLTIYNDGPNTTIDPSYASMAGVTIVAPASSSAATQIAFYPSVFPSWAAFVAYLGTLRGQIFIYLQGAVAVPTGAWTMPNSYVLLDPSASAVMTFADGASLTNAGAFPFIDGVQLVSNSNSPVFATTSSTIRLRKSNVIAQANGSVIQATGSGSFSLVLDSVGMTPHFSSPGKALGLTGFTSAAVQLRSGSAVVPNAITGVSTITYASLDASSIVNPTQNGATVSGGYYLGAGIAVQVPLVSAGTTVVQGANVYQFTSGSPPTGALIIEILAFAPAGGFFLDFSGVDMSAVTSLEFAFSISTTVMSATPKASGLYYVYSNQTSFIAYVPLQSTGYAPGDVTKWASPRPTTIQQAIDRIAAVVGLSTPIP